MSDVLDAVKGFYREQGCEVVQLHPKVFLAKSQGAYCLITDHDGSVGMTALGTGVALCRDCGQAPTWTMIGEVPGLTCPGSECSGVVIDDNPLAAIRLWNQNQEPRA